MNPNFRIVVLEDDPIIAADLVERICDLGYPRPESYDFAEDALAAMIAAPPALAIVDIQLAGEMDGVEAVRRFREARSGSTATAVIFLTGNTDEASFSRARPLSPRAYIGKPFRGSDLRHAIELAIGTPPSSSSPPSSSPSPSLAPQKDPETASAPPADEGEIYRLRDRIFIRHKDRLVRLLTADIAYVRADGYYCYAKTHEREHLVTRTLKKLMPFLPAEEGFYRAHRSYIINLRHIEAIDTSSVTIAGDRVPVSKGAREGIMKALQDV